MKEKTMRPFARQICYEGGDYKNGECPDCGDYITDNGDCMFCDFHSALIPKPNETKEETIQ